jgi:hypothetical protein
MVKEGKTAEQIIPIIDALRSRDSKGISKEKAYIV